MTTPDTQAPERIWLDAGTYNGVVGFAHCKQHHVGEWQPYIRADLVSARTAAAVMQMRSDIWATILRIVNPKSSEDHNLIGNMHEEIFRLPLPDTTALDTLIAAARREVWDEALREAVTICKQVRNHEETSEDEAVGALSCAMAIMDEVNRRAAERGT